jgi:hypothetical protein
MMINGKKAIIRAGLDYRLFKNSRSGKLGGLLWWERLLPFKMQCQKNSISGSIFLNNQSGRLSVISAIRNGYNSACITSCFTAGSLSMMSRAISSE